MIYVPSSDDSGRPPPRPGAPPGPAAIVAQAAAAPAGEQRLRGSAIDAAIKQASRDEPAVLEDDSPVRDSRPSLSGGGAGGGLQKGLRGAGADERADRLRRQRARRTARARPASAPRLQRAPRHGVPPRDRGRDIARRRNTERARHRGRLPRACRAAGRRSRAERGPVSKPREASPLSEPSAKRGSAICAASSISSTRN